MAGFLELNQQGAGVLRHAALASPDDARLSARMVRELGLRAGDLVEGTARGDQVQAVALVNGAAPEALAGRRSFSELTAVHPESPLVLGSRPGSITGRLLDLIAPVGKGQRGLIVAPPKAGKTTLLRDIALGLGEHRSLTILTLLVAERPEEVTELRRTVPGSVLAADLDQPSAWSTPSGWWRWAVTWSSCWTA